MTKENLIGKGFVLFVEGLIAGAFIQAITEIVKNSIWEMKAIWFILYLLFVITDLIIYTKYGEEIIFWFLNWIGIEIN